MSKTIVGIFDSYSSAENAAKEIKEHGFKIDNVSIVAKQGDQQKYNNNQYVDNNPNGVFENIRDNREQTSINTNPRAINDNISDGVVTGGILGGLTGLLIGAGSMIIPGLGIIAAAGPITGLISGAITGGIVGGLVDLGIPESKGREYEGVVKEGKILFTMKVDDDKVQQISSILKTNGALNIESY